MYVFTKILHIFCYVVFLFYHVITLPLLVWQPNVDFQGNLVLADIFLFSIDYAPLGGCGFLTLEGFFKNAKFKMAAIKSLALSYLPQYLR